MKLRLPELVGALAVLIGFVAVADRGLAALLTLDQSLLLVLAVLALLLGLAAARERRDLDRRFTETPDVEGRYEAPRPGEDIDRQFAQTRGFSRLNVRRKVDLRERVARAAVAALSSAGLTESDARERIERGTWTADPVAAWFLAPDLVLPLRARLRTMVGGSRYEIAASRAIQAIADVQANRADVPAAGTDIAGDGADAASDGADAADAADDVEAEPGAAADDADTDTGEVTDADEEVRT